MKQFYTVRDIEDMHAAGVVEIEIHDDVVLTDVAREKAIVLGMSLKPVESTLDDHHRPGLPRAALAAGTNPPAAEGAGLPPAAVPPSLSQAAIGGASADRVMKIKTAVEARLGTDKYNDLLDKIIPQVMSQLKQ